MTSRSVSRAIVGTGMLTLMIAAAGCTPPRPSGVSPHATWVSWGLEGSGVWVHCWLDEEIQLNRCHSYDRHGTRIYRATLDYDDDDVYLPYFSKSPIPEGELIIDRHRSQVHYFYLESGEVMLPRNAYEIHRKFIDDVMAAREGR